MGAGCLSILVNRRAVHIGSPSWVIKFNDNSNGPSSSGRHRKMMTAGHQSYTSTGIAKPQLALWVGAIREWTVFFAVTHRA
jgi:hypothetical protein